MSLNTPWQHKKAEGDPQPTHRITLGSGRTEGTTPCAKGWLCLVRETEIGRCRSFMGTAFLAGECFWDDHTLG